MSTGTPSRSGGPLLAARFSPLLLILSAAVVQGWALYGLHIALRDDLWPATDRALDIAFYVCALFVPATAQLLAGHGSQRAFWVLVVALGVAFFGFSWYHGNVIAGQAALSGSPFNEVSLAITLVVLWLMLLPFLDIRLTHGFWRASYHEFFTRAWRNKLLLAEAAVFTGLLWLLLILWATLFMLLGIGFFQELFREPLFAYPVSAITFGVALYLIGSVDRFVDAVLEQILGLLKWLGVIAGFILAFFSLALVFRLPGLLATGTRVISAAWLLWLLAVMVLLLNAAYRDGQSTHPYPALLARSLSFVVPLMVLVCGVALYSLGVRIAAYGLTPERFWALIVALAALVYSTGYSVAAFRSGPWMNGMGAVNVSVAIGLIVVLALAMTPVLSPFRLSASSQYRQILDRTPGDETRDDSYRYLRFAAGRYGRAYLQELVTLEDHPRAKEIRELAAQALASNIDQFPPVRRFNPETLTIFPQGRFLEPALLALLQPAEPAAGIEVSTPSLSPDIFSGCRADQCAGLFIDLDADGMEEFLVISQFTSFLFVRDQDGWRRDATANLSIPGGWDQILEALKTNDFAAQDREYRDLRIGNRVIQITGGISGRATASP